VLSVSGRQERQLCSVTYTSTGDWPNGCSGWQAVGWQTRICHQAEYNQAFPHTASKKPPSERPQHFETCRMNEKADYVIQLKVGAGGIATVGQLRQIGWAVLGGTSKC
jgi:hypothetical protein